MPPEIILGAAHLVSSPSDVNKFLTALMTGKILSAESLAWMTDTRDNNYGLGLQRFRLGGMVSYGHTGGSPAFNCIAFYCPRTNLAVTVMLNARCGISSREIASAVLDILKEENII